MLKAIGNVIDAMVYCSENRLDKELRGQFQH
jgi:hypothetical protein